MAKIHKKIKHFFYIGFCIFSGFVSIKVCKIGSTQNRSDLFFVPESRDVRETGDTISLSYLFYSSLEKSPKLPGTNIFVCH